MKVTNDLLPVARSSDIVVQEIENETLVYDLLDHNARQLNESMSLIWKNCDGETSVSELIDILENQPR